jgi:enamine deaminase RidA (YjgF/YER057c/UK114 family)
MTVQLLSPEGMFQPVPYAHVSVATGTRHVHVAGQIARDADANQVAQVLRNTALGLAGAGASFADVVRLRFFVTQWSPEKIADFMDGVDRVAVELGITLPLPPASLIGVDFLFEPDVLVELEAYAVLD